MIEIIKIVGIFILILFVSFVIGWMAMGNELLATKFFAPKFEAVRRSTFEQSKAYKQGVIQELNKAYTDYSKASPEERKAIASIVRNQVADIDEKELPTYLRIFVDEIRVK